MKTAELIRALQQVDPEGTAEVVVGGRPIYFVEKLPGYYDGPYEILIQDHTKDPYYNIVGMRQTRSGTKLRLVTIDMEDLILDNPDILIELDPSIGPERLASMEKWVEEKRQESRKINEEIAEWKKNRQNSTS